MSQQNRTSGRRYREAIQESGLSIYDPVKICAPGLWIPMPELERLLNDWVKGISLAGLPLRTRSKVLKEHICHALGYPVPAHFKKTKPRFLGQDFDTYIQKSNNLQIWNDSIVPTRRYVIIRVGEEGTITRVRVINGDSLALLDTTGTLTQKYQALLSLGTERAELISEEDTDCIRFFVQSPENLTAFLDPLCPPQPGRLLPIKVIFERLQSLIGQRFAEIGIDQERKRGATLQQLVCQHLGYKDYRDNGSFPDIPHQLLELKLQTSQTIDLGLVCPPSVDPLEFPVIQGQQLRHCDVRYALFFAQTDGHNITLTHLFLTTGEKFLTRFPLCQGKKLNKKLQIPLPADFFFG